MCPVEVAEKTIQRGCDAAPAVVAATESMTASASEATTSVRHVRGVASPSIVSV
jgi:hypothetical protein